MATSTSGLVRMARSAISATAALAMIITPIAPAFAQTSTTTPDQAASTTPDTQSQASTTLQSNRTPSSDTTAPVITLLGDATVNLTVGDTYADAGATAKDDVDGDITANIVTTGARVDTSAPGSFTVTYDVSDAAGNKAAEVTRTVNVKAASSSDDVPPPSKSFRFNLSTALTTPTPSATTDAPTNVTASDATLNGTNGSVDADNASFWVSTSTIDDSNPNSIPSGVYSTQVLGPVASSTAFSAQLSSVTTNGIPGNMAAVTASTTYHYVAWIHENSQWYHGAEQTVTTSAVAAPDAPAIAGFTQDGNTLICGASTNTNGTSPLTTHMQWTESSSGINQYEIFPTYPDATGEHQYFIPGSALDAWIGDNFTHHGEGEYSYVIRAQGASGTWSANSAPCALTYDTGAPAVTPTTVDVKPSAMNGWYFYNDHGDAVLAANADHGFTTGPSTALLGTGSAHLTKTTDDSYGIATTQFAGTPLSSITALSFATYRASGTSAQAPSLGFDVDSDATDGDTSYQGRLTYEPYFTQTVNTGAWQDWNTLDDSAGTGTGNWWFSHGTLSGGAASQCTQANPCTWSELLHDYPNASMRSVGQLILRTNGATGEAFDGNVDDLRIATTGADTSFNFDPDAVVVPPLPTLAITAPAADGDTASSTYDFTADYQNGVTTSLQWAVRSGANAGCYGGTTVAGDVDGHSDASTLTGADFSANLDTTAWTNGNYCFVVNDGHGQRVARTFSVDNYTYSSADSKFTANPEYVRANNGGDTAAVVLVPAGATAAHFTYTQTDGSGVYTDVNGAEHVQAGQFPVPGTGQHQYRGGVSAAEGVYTVTGEYEVGGTWYPITGSATLYVLGTPTGDFILPSASSSIFRPSDNPLRIEADDANDTFRDVVFNVNGTNYQVNRADCDLREAGNRVICDVSSASNWTGLSDGAYTATATLYNLASNHAAITSPSFTVSSSAPTVTNFLVLPTSVASSSISVSADASDPAGIKDVNFYITAPRVADGICDGNGTKLADSDQTSGTGSTYTATLDTSALSGKYCVNVVAGNLAATHSHPQSLAVTVDTTAPSVPTNGLPNGTATSTNDFYFTWATSTDDQTGPVTYEFHSSMNPSETGGVLTSGLWTSGTLTSPTIHSTGAPDGTWYWQVRAQDAAGNWSGWSPIWNVTLDTQAPAKPVITSPADGSTLTSATWNDVTWTDVTDSGTPITYVYQSATDPSTNPDGSFANPAYTSGTLATTSQATPGTSAGTYYVHVKAVDAAGNSMWSDPIAVIVDNASGAGHPTDNAPVASDQSIFVDEGGSVAITLAATDADGDALTFATTSSPTSGTLSGTLATDGTGLTYTPGTGFTGTDSFTFTANDGAEDSAPATVSITVRAPDSPLPTGSFTITPSAMQDWATSTASGAGAGFVTDATSPNGVGALQLTTTADDNSVTHMTSPSFSMPLSDLSALSYETNVISVPAAQQQAGNATLRVNIDINGDGTIDDQLMFEPYYNGYDGTTQTGWQTFSISSTSGKFWSNHDNSYNGLGGVSAGSYASNFTLADVLHDYPNAKVIGLVLSMGSYNDSQTVEADNLQLTGSNGTTQYSFEPDATQGNPGGGITPRFASSFGGGSSGQIITNTNQQGSTGTKEVLGASTYNFTRDLRLGMSGDDVTALQQFLIQNGYSIPAGATGYFGLQTQAALSKFQLDNGITPAVGYFGPITRALVNTGTIETTPAGSGTNASIQSEIANLLAQLAALQAKVASSTASTTNP